MKYTLAGLSLRFINLDHPFPWEATRGAKFRWCNRIFLVVRSDEIGRKSRWYFGKSRPRISRENYGKSCSIRRRNKSRGNVTLVPWRDIWFYLRGRPRQATIWVWNDGRGVFRAENGIRAKNAPGNARRNCCRIQSEYLHARRIAWIYALVLKFPFYYYLFFIVISVPWYFLLPGKREVLKLRAKLLNISVTNEAITKVRGSLPRKSD